MFDGLKIDFYTHNWDILLLLDLKTPIVELIICYNKFHARRQLLAPCMKYAYDNNFITLIDKW